MTFSEFLTGAMVTDSFEQVAHETAEQQKVAIPSDSKSRRDEEWGILANQVVGQENLPLS